AGAVSVRFSAVSPPWLAAASRLSIDLMRNSDPATMFLSVVRSLKRTAVADLLLSSSRRTDASRQYMAIVAGSSTAETLQILVNASRRITARNQVADDRDRTGARGNHGRRGLEGDASDG